MADKIGEKKKPLGVTTQTMKAESKKINVAEGRRMGWNSKSLQPEKLPEM